jgi:hypothetical protein
MRGDDELLAAELYDVEDGRPPVFPPHQAVGNDPLDRTAERL